MGRIFWNKPRHQHGRFRESRSRRMIDSLFWFVRRETEPVIENTRIMFTEFRLLSVFFMHDNLLFLLPLFLSLQCFVECLLRQKKCTFPVLFSYIYLDRNTTNDFDNIHEINYFILWLSLFQSTICCSQMCYELEWKGMKREKQYWLLNCELIERHSAIALFFAN